MNIWQRLISIFLTILLLFTSLPATAQELRVPPQIVDGNSPRVPDRLVEPLNNSGNEVVGTIDGNFQVTGDGAAQYTVPMAIPPGRGGIEPRISLVYNSRQQDGPLGVGWSISGLSSISRCGSNWARDGHLRPVKFDSEDHFCLDGMRLVAVQGDYGQNGTEYRTEQDTFAKIVSYGNELGPTSFKIWQKDGRISTYGKSEDCNDKNLNNPCSGLIMARNGVVRTWALNKVEDRFGNYMEITYFRYFNRVFEDLDGDDVEDFAGQRETVEFYPNEITYTGQSEIGLSPQRSVTFSYSNRSGDNLQGHFSGIQGNRI
jgi:hypothetical protein